MAKYSKLMRRTIFLINETLATTDRDARMELVNFIFATAANDEESYDSLKDLSETDLYDLAWGLEKWKIIQDVRMSRGLLHAEARVVLELPEPEHEDMVPVVMLSKELPTATVHVQSDDLAYMLSQRQGVTDLPLCLPAQDATSTSKIERYVAGWAEEYGSAVEKKR